MKVVKTTLLVYVTLVGLSIFLAVVGLIFFSVCAGSLYG